MLHNIQIFELYRDIRFGILICELIYFVTVTLYLCLFILFRTCCLYIKRSFTKSYFNLMQLNVYLYLLLN